jgi:ankyrin repeat protein
MEKSSTKTKKTAGDFCLFFLLQHTTVTRTTRENNGREKKTKMSWDKSSNKMHNAVIEGNEDAVLKFLADGWGVDCAGEAYQTPLMRACQHGHLGIVKLLVARGASKNHTDSYGNTAFLYAACHAHPDIVSFLLDQNVDTTITNYSGISALLFPALLWHQDRGKEEKRRVVELLLAKTDLLDAQDEKGKTALMTAIEKGHQDLADLLLQHNPRLEIQDKEGHTALAWAALQGNLATFSMLMRQGAQLSVGDKRGLSLLMKISKCCERNGPQIAQVLLEHGANVNARSKGQKNTALMYAAQNNQIEMAEWLLDNGAEIDAANSYGYTAYSRAADFGNDELAQLLQRRGANTRMPKKDFISPYFLS